MAGRFAGSGFIPVGSPSPSHLAAHIRLARPREPRQPRHAVNGLIATKVDKVHYRLPAIATCAIIDAVIDTIGAGTVARHMIASASAHTQSSWNPSGAE